MLHPRTLCARLRVRGKRKQPGRKLGEGSFLLDFILLSWKELHVGAVFRRILDTLVPVLLI